MRQLTDWEGEGCGESLTRIKVLSDTLSEIYGERPETENSLRIETFAKLIRDAAEDVEEKIHAFMESLPETKPSE